MSALDLFFLPRDRPLGGREARPGVRAVAERLVRRAAAAAERDRRLVGRQLVAVAVRVDERELAADQVRAVLACCDLCHGRRSTRNRARLDSTAAWLGSASVWSPRSTGRSRTTSTST